MIDHFLQLLNHMLLPDNVGELHAAKIGFDEKKKAEVTHFCFSYLYKSLLQLACNLFTQRSYFTWEVSNQFTFFVQ